ncbi:Aste57867_25434 [Aphanomyces stellatus]|uniref:Aste57867_25434 protein n=1 Tax=Aphanomyces stellatus TaxID=120398 RepID=A0A485LT95_9STRA|nr:hypothetical protein As57867_025355 [Aphanomyces stellatus]VFU02057.1 Aste57867_25434 [Aphanomyces stellatus]
MECAAGLFSCYTGNCFGEAQPDDMRATTDRNPCPQLFKLKSLLVHVPSCNSVLRLGSTNCKIACLPTGLVKKIVFLYLRGRYEIAAAASAASSTDVTDSEGEDAELPGDDEGKEHTGSERQGALFGHAAYASTTSITSSLHSMREAYNFARTFSNVESTGSSESPNGLDLKVLQDSYMLTFRKGGKEKEQVEVKLFMVNASPPPTTDTSASPPARDLKIVNVLLRDNLWVDVLVSEDSPASAPLNTTDVLESQMVFQLFRCDDCGDFDACACDAPRPETIWRREEDIRLDECVVKKRRNGQYLWQDHLLHFPTLHKCSAICDVPLGVLNLFLVSADHAVTTEFDVAITSSKKVVDLSDEVYIMFCITVCHGELKWHITRRFRDFTHMHTLLVKELHLTASELADLPKLPPKTWLPTTDSQFIHERQLLLETYLRQMTLHTGAMQSVAFLSFLGALSSPRLEHEWISGVPRDVIHLRILHRYVELGDILLFQSKNSMSGMQRTVTGAEWDHVAMVVEGPRVPNKAPKFMLLEATGDGVTVMPLVSRILAYNSCFINYIALRKLRMPPSAREAFRTRLLAFLHKVEGKPYSMTLDKLMRPSETNANLSGFFCSELIAAALKASGLIDDSFAASSFWPGSFGSGQEVDRELARHDAYLEEEVVIDCRVLEIALANKDEHGVGTVVHHND